MIRKAQLAQSLEIGYREAAGGHIATKEKPLAMLEAGSDLIGENTCCQIMERYEFLMEKRHKHNSTSLPERVSREASPHSRRRIVK